MASLSPAKTYQRITGLLSKALGAWNTSALRPYAWRLLSVISIVLVSASSLYAWYEWPSNSLQVQPLFLGLAAVIYVITYAMHTIGWHFLAVRLFGPISISDNAEAVAASNLVKSLPTVAWYIASRTDFYAQRQVPRKRVVAAAMYELVMMIVSGILLFLIVRAASISLWLIAPMFVFVLALCIILPRTNMALQQLLRRKFDLKNDGDVPWQFSAYWLALLAWYGIVWLMGVGFVWSILRSITPLELSTLLPLMDIWLVACLAGYAISLSLGTLGIAREITLTFLLAQQWSLPIAIAAAILIKIALTFGELGCSVLVLAKVRLWRKYQL